VTPEIKEVVRETVRETFLTLGVNLDDSDGVTEVQSDFSYLRKSRVGSEQAATWVKRGAIGVFMSGLAWLVWVGIKEAIK